MTELLVQNGIRWCSVYSLQEAHAVLARTPSLNVHVLCPVSFQPGPRPCTLPEAWTQVDESGAGERVHLTIQTPESAEILDSLARAAGRRLKVHIQLDTGLTRQGCLPEELPQLLRTLSGLKHLELTGIFAHFSHGEIPASPITEAQYARFLNSALPLRAQGVLLHIHNSGGTQRKVPMDVDLVRLGIGLYGLQPGMDHPINALQPIAELIAPVAAVHKRPAGTGVGYGHRFVTARESKLAVIPVGYADGYRRELGGQAVVEIHRKGYPVVGRVSMDQIVVDVTDGDVREGDMAILISSDPASPISMDHLARTCRTIGYELATGLGARLIRRLI
jgi:alanine racemase